MSLIVSIFTHNFRYEDGNRTCYMSNGTEILPMWDWIENASYAGRLYNEDEWVVYYVSKSTK